MIISEDISTVEEVQDDSKDYNNKDSDLEMKNKPKLTNNMPQNIGEGASGAEELSPSPILETKIQKTIKTVQKTGDRKKDLEILKKVLDQAVKIDNKVLNEKDNMEESLDTNIEKDTTINENTLQIIDEVITDFTMSDEMDLEKKSSLVIRCNI